MNSINTYSQRINGASGVQPPEQETTNEQSLIEVVQRIDGLRASDEESSQPEPVRRISIQPVQIPVQVRMVEDNQVFAESREDLPSSSASLPVEEVKLMVENDPIDNHDKIVFIEDAQYHQTIPPEYHCFFYSRHQPVQSQWKSPESIVSLSNTIPFFKKTSANDVIVYMPDDSQRLINLSAINKLGFKIPGGNMAINGYGCGGTKEYFIKLLTIQDVDESPPQYDKTQRLKQMYDTFNSDYVYNNFDARLATFKGHDLEFPNHKIEDLANAGLVYFNSGGDRTKCYLRCNDQIILEWEKNDIPLLEHAKLGGDSCPFLEENREKGFIQLVKYLYRNGASHDAVKEATHKSKKLQSKADNEGELTRIAIKALAKGLAEKVLGTNMQPETELLRELKKLIPEDQAYKVWYFTQYEKMLADSNSSKAENASGR